MRQNDSANLLYVGRLAPNKGCDDLIKLFYTYRNYINPAARLWLVGSRSFTGYVRYLEALIARLGLERRSALSLIASRWAGCAPVMRPSDVLLYGSRHEGFGVPLVEAMYFGLPVVAYAAAAVPETLGGAGVLFNRWAYAEVAELLDLVYRDADFRQRIIEGQRRRLADFDPISVENGLRSALIQLGVL